MSRRERIWKRVDWFRDRWIWLIWLLLALGLAVEGNTWWLLVVGVVAGIRLEQRFPEPRNRRRSTEIHVHVDEQEIAQRVGDMLKERPGPGFTSQTRPGGQQQDGGEA